MTGIQEILRVFFFSLLLLHDLMLAFACNVLYYVAPVYFWAIWAHFHFSTSTWLDAQKNEIDKAIHQLIFYLLITESMLLY